MHDQRHRETERLCSLEVNDQLEFCWLLYGKIGGTHASKNFVDVYSRTAVEVRVAWPICNQPSGIRVLFRHVNCGQVLIRCKFSDQESILLRKGVHPNHERVYMLALCRHECRSDVFKFPNVKQHGSNPNFPAAACKWSHCGGAVGFPIL